MNEWTGAVEDYRHIREESFECYPIVKVKDAMLEAQFASLGLEASSIAPGEYGTKATLHSEAGNRTSDGAGRAVE